MGGEGGGRAREETKEDQGSPGGAGARTEQPGPGDEVCHHPSQPGWSTAGKSDLITNPVMTQSGHQITKLLTFLPLSPVRNNRVKFN